MVIELTVLDLALAALLILALAGVSLHLGLGIGQRLVVSAARTTIQLLLIGLVKDVAHRESSLGEWEDQNMADRVCQRHSLRPWRARLHWPACEWSQGKV